MSKLRTNAQKYIQSFSIIILLSAKHGLSESLFAPPNTLHYQILENSHCNAMTQEWPSDGNHRPISLTRLICTAMEHILDLDLGIKNLNHRPSPIQVN